MNEGKTMLVLGATSAIAESVCREAARRGWRLLLAARKPELAEADAQSLHVQFGIEKPSVFEFEVRRTESHRAFLEEILLRAPDLDCVFVAAGILHPQAECDTDFALSEETIAVNFTGLVSILSLVADHFEKRRRGIISCITSVAGDRGRKSNYAYGAAKAGMTVWLQGLRNRLFSSGVRVQTLKLGPVETRMIRIAARAPFPADPDDVAVKIMAAIEKRRDGDIYIPWFWEFIMLGVRAIPEPLFKRMSL